MFKILNGELGMTERGIFKNGNVVCSDILINKLKCKLHYITNQLYSKHF